MIRNILLALALGINSLSSVSPAEVPAFGVPLPIMPIEMEQVDGDQEVMKEYEIQTEDFGQVGQFLYPMQDIRINRLVIIGKMDSEDFKSIWNHARAQRIEVLDLSQAVMKDNEIPDNALYEKSQGQAGSLLPIGEIILPEGVVRIGDHAFAFCGMRKINIPSTVRSFGNSAFVWCVRLDCQLIFPEGLEVIPQDILAYSQSLTIPPVFPSTLKEIGLRAFMFNRFESLELPDNLEKIGAFAFQAYAATIPHLIIPDGCEDIGEYAFAGLMWLESVQLPAHIEYIPPGMLEAAMILTELNLNSACKVIGTEAFSNCENLSKVTFNNGLERIEEDAFRHAELESLSLPSSLQYIGPSAFAYAKANQVFCKATVPPEFYYDVSQPSKSSYNNNLIHESTLYVPEGSGSLYQVANGWKEFKEIVEVRFSDDVPLISDVEPTEKPWYNLQGCPVNEPVKGNIYIQNGKKIIFN